MAKSIRVGFTGTQLGMTEKQKASVALLMSNPKISEFHHGDCIGADAEANSDIGVCIIVHMHPPINRRYRAFCRGADVIHPVKEYLERNRDIVDMTDILIAAPHQPIEQRRGGTWMTIRYARKMHKQTYIVYPNGFICSESHGGKGDRLSA